MRFNKIEKGFQYAFSAALRAYRRGSIAIGCAIMNTSNECIATGENSIYADDNSEKINRHNLAHAEINAILKAGSGRSNKDVSNYTLYTTMEPCIMCFGAIVMCYYKNVKFATVDPIGGATQVNIAKYDSIKFEGPFEYLQDIQIALTIYRGFALNLSHIKMMIERYSGISEYGVAFLGKKLYDDAVFNNFINQEVYVTDEELFDYMFERL